MNRPDTPGDKPKGSASTVASRPMILHRPANVKDLLFGGTVYHGLIVLGYVMHLRRAGVGEWGPAHIHACKLASPNKTEAREVQERSKKFGMKKTNG